jgi:hypothetical protein
VFFNNVENLVKQAKHVSQVLDVELSEPYELIQLLTEMEFSGLFEVSKVKELRAMVERPRLRPKNPKIVPVSNLEADSPKTKRKSESGSDGEFIEPTGEGVSNYILITRCTRLAFSISTTKEEIKDHLGRNLFQSLPR